VVFGLFLERENGRNFWAVSISLANSADMALIWHMCVCVYVRVCVCVCVCVCSEFM
jgi:hypothetical protein